MSHGAIESSLLEQPQARIDFQAYVKLMRKAKELCGDPALALHFGEEVDLMEISFVGMAGGASLSLEEGFAQLNRHAAIDVDFHMDGDRFGVEQTGDAVWVVDRRPHPNEFPEFTESFFARAATGLRRWLGDAAGITAVEVTHSEPSYRSEYDRIFRVPVLFDSGRNALQTSGGLWAAFRDRFPPNVASEILREHAAAQAEKLRTATTVRGSIETLLTAMLPSGKASMDAVAGRLALSRQTLFRRLRDEGTTFERVLDELRHRLAQRYLNEEHRSVGETAYLVGFSDPAAFSRAFKRWTGRSPGASRTIRTQRPAAPESAENSPSSRKR